MSTRHVLQRLRYASTPLRAHQRWRTYEPGTAKIAGLPGVRPIEPLDGDVAFVPLPGHGQAHAGIAVRTRTGWLLHAGDAYLHRDELDHAAVPGLHQRLVETSASARAASVEHLRTAGAEVTIFCSHDAAEFNRCVGAIRTTAVLERLTGSPESS